MLTSAHSADWLTAFAPLWWLRHHLSPASGGTTTRAKLRITYEKKPHGALFCHRLRGKSREAGKGDAFPSPAGRLYGFRRQRRYKKWRRRRRTSPAGTVSQPIGKPFNGQAKGLLWLTWRSYAGPPQYFIPPEGGALNPSGRRQPVPDRTLAAQGQRPGGWLNLHARKGVSTFGNTGVSVKFSSVIHLTVDNYYLRGFGFISISV